MNMMVPPSDNSFHHCFHILLALLLFSLQILTHHIQAYGSKVEVLPGFQGPLPFDLETGLQILTHHIQAYGSKVEVLPGFQGPLPFELETGHN
ncbi:sinapoylglucose--choline O-sinapoyltransferase [Trifolium repens]|nr:sinapoylglucose--choline O-sinapoyltransferase [Trifolium repens]